MASGSRQKTTMAKLMLERALQERRELKKAKKAARRAAAAEPAPVETSEPVVDEPAPEASPDWRALHLLGEVAGWLLEGRPRPPGPPRSLRAALPRSAMETFDRLLGVTGPAPAADAARSNWL